jgi:hypothetical protein
MRGYIHLVSSTFESMGTIRDTITYDVLMKDEFMVWMFRYRQASHNFEFVLQAGAVSIELILDDAVQNTKMLKFDNVNASSNVHQVKAEAKSAGKYIKIKVTALEDSDYSMELLKPTENRTYPAQIGRPNKITLSK